MFLCATDVLMVAVSPFLFRAHLVYVVYVWPFCGYLQPLSVSIYVSCEDPARMPSERVLPYRIDMYASSIPFVCRL